MTQGASISFRTGALHPTSGGRRLARAVHPAECACAGGDRAHVGPVSDPESAGDADIAGRRGVGAGGPRLDVIRPEGFFSRLAVDGLIGLGEAWMTGDFTAGDWHSAGATALQTRAASNAGAEPSVSGFARAVAAGATPGRPAVPSRQTVLKATDELAAALTVLARHTASLIPRPVNVCAGCGSIARRRPRQASRQWPGVTPGGPTTCPMSCSRCA